MNSIEDVYNELKKYDNENKLTLSNDGESIELEVNNNEIVAFDGCISVAIKSSGLLTKKDITHWHPDDYNEMYHDLLSILKGRTELPTLKYMRKVQVKDALIIIISTIIAVIVSAIFKLDKFFPTIILVIIFILLFILIIVVIKKLIIFTRIRTKKVNMEDMEAIKKYLIMPYPPYTHDLRLDLTFDYLGMVSSEFLKYPKRIRLPYPLEFCDEEIIEIEKRTSSKEKDKDVKKLYEYYKTSLDIIEIIYKYYDKNGIRKS
jgi:hypothetical protein